MSGLALLVALGAGLAVGFFRATWVVASVVAAAVVVLLSFAFHPLDSDEGTLLFLAGCFMYAGFASGARRIGPRRTAEQR